jgi:phosphate-selective porin OprO and OprP
MFINKSLCGAGASLAAIVSLASLPLKAQAASDTDRIEKLERAVELLEKQNAELKAEVSSLKKEQTAVVPEGKMKTKITSEGKTYVEKAVEEKLPIYVQQRGPELKLVLGGFIQFNSESGDVFAFQGNFGQTAINDRFRLRRARISLTGDYAEQFDFKLEGDFEQNDGTSPSTRVDFSGTDIWINYHQFPAAQVKAGQYKAPFGLEQLTPDTSLFTIERSIATGAITPDRQIGIELWGKPLTSIWPEQKDLVTYYAGFFNGNGRNISVNDNNNFMFASRLELQPLNGKIFGQKSFIKLGGDVFNSRDNSGVNISPTGNLLVNADGSLSAFTLPSAAQRTAWGVDAWFELGPFDLLGEYLQEHVEGRTVNGVVPPFDNFTTDGFYVTGAYYIIPKKLQAVVQWQFLNPGQKGNDGLPSILGGLNYYIKGDNLKLMVNYIHTWSDFREANSEFGRDQFNEVIGRMQLMF